MMKLNYQEIYSTFKEILLAEGFDERKAATCAAIFAGNSRDGVHSHGVNRFPVFVKQVRDGLVRPTGEPALVEANGVIEQWDGNLGVGVYNATVCTDRAIAIAKENGMGCVAIRNTNHWMRGGTYGWQAAEQGCIAILATNAVANMPPWGGITPTLGNNPLVIAVPRSGGHIVLDMAMSQFSYGKLQEYELKNKQLPADGGYDNEGRLSKDPVAIAESGRALPIGLWKGSGLSMLIDLLVSGLSNGRSVAAITQEGLEYGVSQFFLCIHPKRLDAGLIEAIIAFTKGSELVDKDNMIRFPGEQVISARARSESEGIEVNEVKWKEVLTLTGT